MVDELTAKAEGSVFAMSWLSEWLHLAFSFPSSSAYMSRFLFDLAAREHDPSFEASHEGRVASVDTAACYVRTRSRPTFRWLRAKWLHSFTTLFKR